MMNDPVCAIGMNLHGRRAVFAGGGEAAERKLSRLTESGAALTVIAPEVTAEIQKLADAGRIELELRLAEPEDFAGAFLAFISTNDPLANRALARAARDRGALVNQSDDPDGCDFVLPALAWMNTVHIGVFSGSPALSKWVRQHLERTLGPEFPEFAAAFAEIRDSIRSLEFAPETRAEIMARLLNEGLYNTYRDSGLKGAKAKADSVVAAYRNDAL